MKNITIITVLSLVLCVSACTYDYEMPDYSNAAPLYSIKELPTEVKQEWRQIAMEHGLNLDISKEQWGIIVTEKNEKGDILYEGIPRVNADNTARILEVSFQCLGRLGSFDWNYYEICRFKLSTVYKLKVSPIPCVVEITTDNAYTVESSSEMIYTYNVTYGVDVTLVIIDTIESLGYKISKAKMIITEKDKNENILFQGYKKNVSGQIISQKGAETIEITIEFYGWPKGTYTNEVKVGTLTFDPLDLKDINNQETVLTINIPYTIVTFIEQEQQVPTVETIAATNVTQSSATLHGKITNISGSNIMECGFEYGIMSHSLLGKIKCNNNEAEMKVNLTELSDLSLTGDIYYRAYAVNSIGIGYGSILKFNLYSNTYLTTSGINDLKTYTTLGGEKIFGISSNTNWSITTSDSWFAVEPTNGSGNREVTVRVEADKKGLTRTGYLYIHYANKSISIQIFQSPSN